MKRTDEMRLGEELRGFCDCNQGREQCTCRDQTSTLRRHNLANAVELTRLMTQWPGSFTVDPHSVKINDEPILPLPATTEYPSDRRKDPVQRFTMAAQLQLMKALAVLGWAAYFLELLRV